MNADTIMKIAAFFLLAGLILFVVVRGIVHWTDDSVNRHYDDKDYE